MKILELMDKYGFEVTKQGNLFITYCPFHKDEHRPNFTIYEETDSYYCYTCSKGGDAIDFFARMEKIPRAQAQYRLYSDLQSLRDKINKVKVEKPFNDSIVVQISGQFRRFLYSKPEYLDRVMSLMQEVDNRLVRDIPREEAISLITEVSIRLSNIALGV